MIVEVGQSCPLDLAFFLGWVLGMGFVLLGAWFVLFSHKNNVKKYYLNHDEATRKEMVDILHNIENQYDFLDQKCNLKHFRMKRNSVIDMLTYLRKRNMD